MATPWTLPENATEHEEQKDFIRWFRRSYPGVLIFAIPNGGKRGKREAAKLVQEGVVSGVPDLFVPEWLLWIEMKKKEGGSVSKDQREIHKQLRAMGQPVVVPKGSEEAQAEVLRFVSDRRTR